jgi:hypothetical protein
MTYTSKFKELINDQSAFAGIMQTNCSGPLYEEWEAKRRFIARAIPGGGMILDIGCAGGLFLWSLMEWTGYKLDPYGVDIVPEYIEAAKALFPNKADHFAVLGTKDLGRIAEVGLPSKYDYVYCSVLGPEPNLEVVEQSLNLASKRVIFGFYGRNNPEDTAIERQKERDDLVKRADSVGVMCGLVTGLLENPTRFNQVIVWKDK